MSKFLASTFDILPDDFDYFKKIEEILEDAATAFGFRKINTSFLDDNTLYEKHLGKQDEILKQPQNSILKPDGTISLMRAYLDHQFHEENDPLLLYFLGPVFRPHEQYQFGIEIIGTSSSISDAFLIGFVDAFYQKLGLNDVVFVINSFGCSGCQAKIKTNLLNYFQNNKRSLCPHCQNVLSKNPFEIALCQNENCQAISSELPVLVDFLCDSCKENLKKVLEYLDDLNITYDFNPRFTKRKNYHEKIIFDVVQKGSKKTFGNGGRHDGLLKQITGKNEGAVGFFGFIKKMIYEMKRNAFVLSKKKPEIYLIHLGNLARKKSLAILFYLHKAGFKVTQTLDRASLKTQLEKANLKKASFALILGQKEAQDDTIIVRNMLDGSQETVDSQKLLDFLKKRLHNVIKIKKHG